MSTFDLSAARSGLGIGPITNDLDGLRALYRAWCLAIPFDNLRKTNALFRDSDGPLPELEADSFFEAWLAHGTGGTCWAHGEALYTMLKASGFDAKRATASMFDFGPPNHATALVHLRDGSTWLLDNALLTMEPLCIDPASPSLFEDPVHYAEVEIDGDQVIVHGTNPPMPGIFFRLLERDVPFSVYQDRWEASRGMSPFNDRVHIRRNEADSILTIRGKWLFTQTTDGLSQEELDADGIRSRLTETMGIHPGFVEMWAESGAVESSLAPSGPMPEFPVRVAPSKRARK